MQPSDDRSRASSARAAPLPSVGDMLGGKYHLVGVLGRGGMGVVFEGKQNDLARSVAIKVFAEGAEGGPNLARFQREIQILARVAHPNIVSIFDFFPGDPTTPPFVVMELLRGQTLSELVKARGRVEPARAARIGQQLLEGLDVAHGNGIVHRDVKPANVFCVETLQGDFVKLLDFGVAKDLGESRALTAPGMLVGTVSYMAPEQLLGEPAGYLADVYATGAVLYYLLAGRKPFDFESLGETARAVIDREPESFLELRPDATALASVVRTAMAKSKEARFPSARAMHQAIAAAMTVAPPPSSRAPVPTSMPTRDLSAAPPPQGPETTLTSAPLPPALSVPSAPLMLPPAPVMLPPAPPAASKPASGMRWGVVLAVSVVLLVVVVACLATALVVVLELQKPTEAAAAGVDAGAPVVATVPTTSSVPSAGASVSAHATARVAPHTLTGVTPVLSTSAAPSSTAAAPSSGAPCFCQPKQRIDGNMPLCKSLDPVVQCKCSSNEDGTDGCTTPLSGDGWTCANNRFKGPALKNNQACSAYFYGKNQLAPGKLFDCDYCFNQNKRVFSGKNGDACSGFYPNTARPQPGVIDCN